jgi:hypothetical protein
VKFLMSVFAIGAILNVSAPTALGATEGGVEGPTSAPGLHSASGLTLYGAHVMRHTVDEDGSAAAHFTPPLPLDNRMLIGAMQTFARAAYGQHGIEVKDADAFKPLIGSPINFQDIDHEYQFVLEGTIKNGIGVILLSRKEIVHIDPEAELLKQLENH